MPEINSLTCSQPICESALSEGFATIGAPSPAACLGTWHVVETEYKSQDLAEKNLKKRGYFSYFPKQLVLVRRRLKGVQLPPAPTFLPFFFQFGFVRFNSSVEEWPSKHTIKGIKRIMLGTNRTPATVPDARIAELMAGEEARTRLPDKRRSRLTRGLHVAVKTGWHPMLGDLAGRIAQVAKCNGYHTELHITADNGAIWTVTLPRTAVSDE